MKGSAVRVRASAFWSEQGLRGREHPPMPRLRCSIAGPASRVVGVQEAELVRLGVGRKTPYVRSIVSTDVPMRRANEKSNTPAGEARRRVRVAKVVDPPRRLSSGVTIPAALTAGFKSRARVVEVHVAAPERREEEWRVKPGRELVAPVQDALAKRHAPRRTLGLPYWRSSPSENIGANPRGMQIRLRSSRRAVRRRARAIQQWSSPRESPLTRSAPSARPLEPLHPRAQDVELGDLGLEAGQLLNPRLELGQGGDALLELREGRDALLEPR